MTSRYLLYAPLVATVRIIGPSSPVSESEGSLEVRVEVIGKLEIPITLLVSTADGTATGTNCYS